MDETTAAARLSAAIGRKIDPAEVEHVEGAFVILRPLPRRIYQLHAGNVAYEGDAAMWWRNGRPWERAGDERNTPRPLELGAE
ncbi:hypothetical protein [Geodermatophilus obscurus]|uniref:Uncharacterized protein n=1 Tax=Geodermatophilus obscurus (strain ATCC 25078 / DSM 43160 / JCM 3152 / CCUG 61914 / KCC A-0152 / KCTC 9177 / NBRC 13315 / NRRL B-3577 / G-20) TaxID=526225 RepID=D2SBQ9_GEOOG|nr:hypothetical protein [Geodermatophilus obscurus]ADB76166.1 hypothetical protein Gobs_3578 [Geodermatophilus obscurus DSM 43160]